MGTIIVDTLYYIARWLIVALINIADRRKKDMALPIRYFTIFFSIDENVAKDKILPTGKIDHIMAFGALTIVNSLYSTFITILENVFVQCLAYDCLVIYGAFFVERIKNDETILSELTVFIHEDVSHIIKTNILSLLLICINECIENMFASNC